MAGNLKALWTQTAREKVATVDGINLFFGALLGANLGSTEGLGLYDYAQLIVVLTGTVMTLRIFSTSERRAYAFWLLGGYVLTVGGYLTLLHLHPVGLSAAAVDRLAVTLAIWFGMVLTVEFYPTIGTDSPQA